MGGTGSAASHSCVPGRDISECQPPATPGHRGRDRAGGVQRTATGHQSRRRHTRPLCHRQNPGCCRAPMRPTGRVSAGSGTCAVTPTDRKLPCSARRAGRRVGRDTWPSLHGCWGLTDLRCTHQLPPAPRWVHPPPSFRPRFPKGLGRKHRQAGEAEVGPAAGTSWLQQVTMVAGGRRRVESNFSGSLCEHSALPRDKEAAGTAPSGF